MCFDIVTEFKIQHMQNFLFDIFVLYRKDNFHSSIQISRHPVRTSHIDFIHAIIFEIENTAVLQKFSDD